MRVEEIYNQIGQSLMDYIPDEWGKVILNINRVEGVAGWYGVYTTVNGINHNIDVWEYCLNSDIIHELHAITTKGGHNRWNKLKVTLLSTGKFEIDFICDQEYQDEIDIHNGKQ